MYLILTREIWNGPYATSAFSEYAEILPEVGFDACDVDENQLLSKCPSAKILFERAIQHGIFIVGGTVAERVVGNGKEEDKIYNTCLCIDPKGKLVGKHRKMHLVSLQGIQRNL